MRIKINNTLADSEGSGDLLCIRRKVAGGIPGIIWSVEVQSERGVQRCGAWWEQGFYSGFSLKG